MPRRKKSICNPRKPQLPFLENPLHGPVHQYGSPLQKAENPRYVPAKPLDQSTSTAWVSPQFDHTLDLHFAGRRRRHISNSTLQQPSRTRKANQSSLNASKACRKPSVCKFPALDFKALSAVQSEPTDSHLDVRPVQQARKLGPCSTGINTESELVQRGSSMCPLVHASPVPSLHEDGAADDDTPSLPDVDTPEPTPVSRHSSIQIRRLPLPPRATSEESSHVQTSREIVGLSEDSRDLDSSSGTPDGLLSFPVLVQDTPEHEYGMRMTWRRRRELMNYLKDRGKLKSSDILVKGGLLLNINSSDCFD